MFPLGDREIRLAMLGMVDGNGHPYSWSAIFNGYDRTAMQACPYATIPTYLGQQPPAAFGIPGARVTHIWTDDPADAARVAQASLIPQIVTRPEEVIGQVDAVIIATDKGHEHVTRCRPFADAGMPIFVDKPLVDNAADLRQFNVWIAAGVPILSSSCMRYCMEYAPYRCSTHDLGALRYVSMAMAKSWERYGIHALEGVYPILGPGFLSARNTGTAARNIVHLRHRDGVDVVLATVADMFGGFGALQLVGTTGCAQLLCADTFAMFKAQLDAFITYLRTGVRPFPHAETVEMMRLIIAALRSRAEGGRDVLLEEIEV